MRNYVTTFDYGNGQMKLTRNVNSSASISDTSQVENLQWSTGAIVGFIVGSLIALFLLILLIVCCCKRHKKREAQRKAFGVGATQYLSNDAEAEIMQEEREHLTAQTQNGKKIDDTAC